MELLTIEQLKAQKDILWATSVRAPLDDVTTLFWHSLEQLALRLEVDFDLLEMIEQVPTALLVLRGGQDYMREYGYPRPYAVEALILRLDRLIQGLDPSK